MGSVISKHTHTEKRERKRKKERKKEREIGDSERGSEMKRYSNKRISALKTLIIYFNK